MLINFNKFTGFSTRPVDNNLPTKKSVKSANTAVSGNVDKVDISSSYKAFDINSLKNQITALVDSDTSTEKLNELKQQVENGSYAVSSGEIAAALLGYGKKA